MADYTSNHIYSTLPPQKLSSKKKTKEWKEQCVEAVSNMGNSRYMNGRSSWGRKQANYDLVASIINEDDFRHVFDPYGWGQEYSEAQPAKLRDINLVVNKINILKGEEINRPFDHQVVAINGEAVSQKEKAMKEMLMKNAQAVLAKESGIEQLQETDPETGEPIEPKPFDEVQKYAMRSITDIREQWGNDILNYLKHKEKLKLKFSEGWEHALIAAEEIYYVGIVNGDVKLRVCNPLNVEFDRNPDNPYIEDGDWFREDRWMTVGQILDEFGEYLTEKQIKDLDEGNLQQGLSNQMFPEYAYSQKDIQSYERGNSSTRTNSNSTHYLVNHVVWKSMKKIGFVTYMDENDEQQTSVVDETFRMSQEMKDAGYTLEWKWIPEVWHGTKIAESFYVNIEPLPNQTRSMDNPSEVKLPYVGRVYNCTNTIQTSLVDLIKPHQYLYNIVWFRLESEIAKAKGKKMIMDIAQIPKSEGFDVEKWIHFFDTVGIGFINSFEEGTGNMGQGKTSAFNQFTQVDMTLSQSVGQYLSILDKIERVIDKIVGITPQREGHTESRQTATAAQNAVIQSSHSTEPWFFIHNEIKTQVLSHMIESAKFAYPDKKKLNFMTDDMQRISMEMDIEKFSDSDYGVFVSNSSKDNMIFSELRSLGQQALGSGTATLTDIVNILSANSTSELTNLIKEADAKREQQQQAQMQSQQQMQQEQLAAQQQEKEAERMFEAEQNQLDRENKVQVATINNIGFDEDAQGNNQIDVIKQGELSLKQSEAANKQSLERLKISNDSLDKDKDRQLKREEIASKERIAKLQSDTALKNKVAGQKNPQKPIK
jgi:hypothetical protein